MGWTIRAPGFDSRRGLGIFLFTTASRTALGPTKPPIQWVPGALSLGVKRPGREADHSPPSSVEVTMSGATPSLPQDAFMAWRSVKAQGQLYLYYVHISFQCHSSGLIKWLQTKYSYEFFLRNVTGTGLWVEHLIILQLCTNCCGIVTSSDIWTSGCEW
jgi:hypothetical protein